MNIGKFEKLPVLGILRGIDEKDVTPLARCVIEAGLEFVEITMNTAGAASLIGRMSREAGDKLCVGAGTVLDGASMWSALDAGAKFIVTPVLVEDVVRHCVKNNIPVFPGALTPLEIKRAWDAGAAMVKVFPSGLFGPGYFREIKGPFNDIKLLACGGVTPGNMKEYFMKGASAIAFGSSVFKKEWLAAGDYERIGSEAGKFISSYKEREAL